MSGPESQSITSKERKATQHIKTNVLSSALLMNESESSYHVGLNMHSELCTNYNADLKRALSKCILKRKPEITFSDIAGCDYAKEVINMSFVVSKDYPELFKGSNVRPW